MKIPIIILNWNGLSDTLECVQSVFETADCDYEVILVDNGSEGDDFRLLSSIFGEEDRVTLMYFNENLGFTNAHNRVFDQLILTNTAYDYVALLNNDTIVDANWLRSLIDTAKRYDAHMVGSKMIKYFDRHKMDNAGHKMINTGEIIAIGVGKPIHLYNSVSENAGTCAGATLYSVEMLRDIGVFDDYFDTGYEDAEFGVRAKILGYKSVMDPNSIVYHKGSSSILKIVDFEYVLKIQSAVYYSYFKLMPRGVILINFPSFIIKYLAILLIDIVFMRWLFLKALFAALHKVFLLDIKKLIKSRSLFQSRKHIMSNYQIVRMQEFFLLFDLSRFVNDVILRKLPLVQKELKRKNKA